MHVSNIGHSQQAKMTLLCDWVPDVVWSTDKERVRGGSYALPHGIMVKVMALNMAYFSVNLLEPFSRRNLHMGNTCQFANTCLEFRFFLLKD